VNVITRNGGNVWYREALLYWSGDVLDAASRQVLRVSPIDASRAEYATYAEDNYDQLDPGFTVGGPLARDRVWMFGGYVPCSRHSPIGDLPRRLVRPYRQQLARHHATANINAQFGPRWRARGTFNPIPAAVAGCCLHWAAATRILAIDMSRRIIDLARRRRHPEYAIVFRPESDISIGISTTRASIKATDFCFRHCRSICPVSLFTSARVVYTNVPSNNGEREERTPTAAQFDGTLYATAGPARIESRLQIDRIGLDALSGATGNGIFVYWDQSFMRQRPLGYYQVTSNDRLPNLGAIRRAKRASPTLACFFRTPDGWEAADDPGGAVPTTNASLPLSPDPRIPDTAIHFTFLDKIAPRFGVSWDASGTARRRCGSWGVFYDITKLQLSFDSVESRRWPTGYTLTRAISADRRQP
jgi:hypothetical protein